MIEKSLTPTRRIRRARSFAPLALLLAGGLFASVEAQTPTPAPEKPAPEKPADDPAPSRGQRMIDRFDENGDGKLALSEVPEFLRERVGGADKDGDGFLSAAELDAMPRPERGGRRGPGGDGPEGAGPEGMGRRGEGRGMRGFGDPARTIERFDENGDGKIAKSELPERMAERVMAADLDADGFVTLEELKKAEEKRREEQARRMLERMDTNKDGKLSGDEIPERGRERMMRLDTNKDGELTLAELMAPRTRQTGGDEGGGRNPEQILERLDANKDGKLTGDEIPGYMRRRMEQFDKNGDGEITKDELGGPQRRRGGPGGGDRPGPTPAPEKGGEKKGGVDL